MAKTSTRLPVKCIEWKAPVAYQADACRLSDESGLPMTVYAVRDREDCAWFQVAHTFWAEISRTVLENGLYTQPLITYLPTRYFVGHPKLTVEGAR